MSAANTTDVAWDLGVPPSLVQCENVTISWTGPAGVNKTLQNFISGTDYFAETLALDLDLSGSAGVVQWTVDMPAGLAIAFELRNLDSSIYYASPSQTILPGKTDDCLRENPGQLATLSLAAAAASLSVVSPQLFPYASTTTTSVSKKVSSSSSSSKTITSSTSTTSTTSITTTSTLSATTSKGSPIRDTTSHKTTSKPAPIAGGVVGGIALFLLLSFLFFLYQRRRSISSAPRFQPAVEKIPEPRVLEAGPISDGDQEQERISNSNSNPFDSYPRSSVGSHSGANPFDGGDIALTEYQGSHDRISPTAPQHDSFSFRGGGSVYSSLPFSESNSGRMNYRGVAEVTEEVPLSSSYS